MEILVIYLPGLCLFISRALVVERPPLCETSCCMVFYFAVWNTVRIAVASLFLLMLKQVWMNYI